MKKTYFKPQFKVVKLHGRILLQNAEPGTGGRPVAVPEPGSFRQSGCDPVHGSRGAESAEALSDMQFLREMPVRQNNGG